jgi:hypothetical protein
MLWPKDRALNEDEFTDAQRAWRNVASDPDAGKRLLIFPEPMEYAAGASTPQEIGIPELAVLNRDEILTAFPLSPYQLGVPMPGGLNSAETRREDRRDYWEGTIHPRADLLEEAIQVGLLSMYEEATGGTFDFELQEPNMDDAATLTDKAKAFKDLVGIGLDGKETLKAVGLSHIKWTGLPAILDPVQQQMMRQQQVEALSQQPQNPPPNQPPRPMPGMVKAVKAREDVSGYAHTVMRDFLQRQRDRVIGAIRVALPPSKAERMKADTEWWDASKEDSELQRALRLVYLQSTRGSLQVVADTLNRIVPNRAVDRIMSDLLTYGAERIVDINAKTLQAITLELAEGARRGYSISQLIDGVPDEGFRGVMNVGLDNGIGAWDDARAETIARTETALSYNRAALDGYKEFNVSEVLAYDGDFDDVCAERNGQTFTVDEALAIEDHPNGTLDWAPVIDKAFHDERVMKAMVDLAGNMRPIIHANGVEVPVTIDSTEWTEAIRDLEATMKAQPAPVVNVSPTPVTFVERNGTQDVRIVDDITPPKTKRVIRGAPTKQNPAGPIEGVVEV